MTGHNCGQITIGYGDCPKISFRNFQNEQSDKMLFTASFVIAGPKILGGSCSYRSRAKLNFKDLRGFWTVID